MSNSLTKAQTELLDALSGGLVVKHYTNGFHRVCYKSRDQNYSVLSLTPTMRSLHKKGFIYHAENGVCIRLTKPRE